MPLKITPILAVLLIEERKTLKRIKLIKPISTTMLFRHRGTREKHTSSFIKKLEDTLQSIREKMRRGHIPRKPPRVPTPLGRRTDTLQSIGEKRNESEPSPDIQVRAQTRPQA